jgi:hypothetical protein
MELVSVNVGPQGNGEMMAGVLVEAQSMEMI